MKQHNNMYNKDSSQLQIIYWLYVCARTNSQNGILDNFITIDLFQEVITEYVMYLNMQVLIWETPESGLHYPQIESVL